MDKQAKQADLDALHALALEEDQERTQEDADFALTQRPLKATLEARQRLAWLALEQDSK